MPVLRLSILVFRLFLQKKTKTINIYSDTYNATVHSYTHKKDYDIVVSKEFLSKEDNVLIIDDFLAKGSALTALLMLIEKAGAKTAGAGIVIEKAYQGGGNLVRDMGIRVESLAKIKSISKKRRNRVLQAVVIYCLLILDFC